MKIEIALAVVALAFAALVAFRHVQSGESAANPPSTLAEAGPAAATVRPRLPAPRVEFSAAPSEPEAALVPTNVLLRLLHNQESIQLTREQVEPYLTANHRNAGSLLAAFRTSGDTNLLREAMEKFPQDPMVNFAAAVCPGLSPEERRQSLEALKLSAPDNSLANYLSALDAFKAGQSDQAVQELQAAAGKAGFEDYSLEFEQNTEEAWRAAGYPDVEAKALASAQLLLPQLKQLKDLSRNVADLANSYRQSGDEASAQAALQIGLALGRRLEPPGASSRYLIDELVGIAIERIELNTMDPASAYDNAGHTVQNRLDELTAQRNSASALAKAADGLLETMPAQDVGAYFDRRRLFGARQTMQWMIDKYKYGPPAAPQ